MRALSMKARRWLVARGQRALSPEYRPVLKTVATDCTTLADGDVAMSGRHRPLGLTLFAAALAALLGAFGADAERSPVAGVAGVQELISSLTPNSFIEP